jgi:hypothetical protein
VTGRAAERRSEYSPDEPVAGCVRGRGKIMPADSGQRPPARGGARSGRRDRDKVRGEGREGTGETGCAPRNG